MNAIEIQNLSKDYKGFKLDNISLTLPSGCIMGLVGENGAGKSTTIKLILDMIKKSGGEIRLLGKKYTACSKEDIGVVLEENGLPESFNAKEIHSVFKNIYRQWDENTFYSYLNRFHIPMNKKIKTFSKGMKMKLYIAVALSHNAKLLILDEATSGLDPVVRDDVLNMIQDFVADHKHSVLLSSHITSDLEKIADTIVFIHQGKIVFCEAKNVLKSQYGIIKCRQTQFAEIDPADILYYRKQSAEWEMLITDRDAIQKKYPGLQINPATIDEIMLICVKGERP